MRRDVLALLLFGLLLALPFARADVDEYEYDDEDDEPSPARDSHDDSHDAPGPDEDEPDVVVLNLGNFDNIINASKFALVEFYAPWCSHCKDLKPQYARAATAIKGINPDVIVAKVDVTKQEELGDRFDIENYPSLKWFVNGAFRSNYTGVRKEDAIVAWVKKRVAAPVVTLDSVEVLKHAEADQRVVAVGYFTTLEGAAYDAYVVAAKKIDDVDFYQTTAADVASHAGLSEVNSIALIRSHPGQDREALVFSGKHMSTDLEPWILKEKLPLTVEFTHGNAPLIFDSGITKQLLLWGTRAHTSPDSQVYQVFRTVAARYRGRIVFVTVDNEREDASPVADYFGLTAATPPVICGFLMTNRHKFHMQTDITVDNVEEFAKSIADGTAQVQHKSQAVPENDRDGHVRIVVGKTVDHIVLDKNKDVLLEVYAPWCARCKAFEPAFHKLAQRLRNVKSIVIAKMDGTENEHPKVKATGYPTLLFFPAGEEEAQPVELDRNVDRTVRGLSKWLKEHAAIPFELPGKDGGDDMGLPRFAKDEL